MEILFAFLGGLVLTALIAFFVARSVVKSRVSQADEKARMEVVSTYKVEQASLKAELKHSKEAIEDLEGKLDKAQADTERLVKEAKEETKKESAERNAEAMDDLQKRFEETIDKVKAQVKGDTDDMLKARQKEFAEKSNEEIGKILGPMKERMKELKEEMEKGNEAQIELKGKMEGYVQNMLTYSEAARKSADDLANAFKHGSKLQGDWGETILSELLSSQGLTEGVNFETQYVVKDSKGRAVKNADGNTMRLDVILHMGDDREVIIDSKVSLKAYVDYVNAENEEDCKVFLKEHVNSIKKHVIELANKDYSSYIQPPKVSAGFVMMFVPHAGALWTALRAEPSLWRWAADMNVYIADEQSLYGALRIVDITWKQIKQAESHKEVFELADIMIKRVAEYVVRYNAIGEGLTKAVQAYREGAVKLSPEGKSIITTARQLIDLGADAKQMVKVGSSKNSKKKKPAWEILSIDTPVLLDGGASIDDDEPEEVL
jgi:DNA recombination protein RmuC